MTIGNVRNMDYTLNLGVWNGIFAVPDSLVDNYIRTASGNNVKIMLCFLRYCGTAMSPENISEVTGIDVQSVEDGIEYWKQRGVIAITNGEITPLEKTLPSMPSFVAKSEPLVPSNVFSSVRKVDTEPNFLPKDIAKTVNNDKKAEYLFKRTEELFGRALKHSEQQSLMIIIEDAGLPVEVALVLVEYCFSADKASPAYIRKVAFDWMERGITSIDLAESQIVAMKAVSDAEKRFRKMFEITSAFSKAQREFIELWVTKYEFSDEMINEAYQLTLNATGKLSFQYMNKILCNWYSKGIKKPSEIQQQKTELADNKASFNVDEIEKLAMSKYE